MTHVDIHFFEQALDVSEDRWCHGTVDTDCLLSVLIEHSSRTETRSEALDQAFHTLSIDRDRLQTQLATARPPHPFRNHYPVTVRSETGQWVGQRVPTARLVLIRYRIRATATGRSPAPVEVLYGLLGDDEGPAAEALKGVGMPPAQARRLLGLADPGPAHVRPALWPLTRHPREMAAGTATHDEPPESPDPSPQANPISFVFTSKGQELELSARRNGPLVLTSRAVTETSIEMCAETVELLARFLENYKAQLDAERWEPVYQAEQRHQPRPPHP